MKLVENIYEENGVYYEYVEDYKKCSIYRKIVDRNFIAFDYDDVLVGEEVTIKLIRHKCK